MIFRMRKAFWTSILTIVAISAMPTGTAGNEEKKPKEEAHKEEKHTAEAEEQDESSDEKSNHGSRGFSSCLVSEAAIQDIKLGREELETKKKELATRESELKSKEEAVAAELKKLESLREIISTKQESQKKEDAEKVAKVVETLLAMSPKAAAKLLGTLDDQLAVTAVSQMETVKLAKVMNLMDPIRASKLTEMLTGINRGQQSPIEKEKRSLASNEANKSEPIKSEQIEKGGEKNGNNEQSRRNEPNTDVRKQAEPNPSKIEKSK